MRFIASYSLPQSPLIWRNNPLHGLISSWEVLKTIVKGGGGCAENTLQISFFYFVELQRKPGITVFRSVGYGSRLVPSEENYRPFRAGVHLKKPSVIRRLFPW
jgi:hypothetical protein